MRELSLFSGAGGSALAGLILGHRCIGYVEYDAYCQEVLQARQVDGSLPPAPIFGDIRAFLDSGAAASYRGVADLVSGGFPCPPFSVAGKRAGAADPRNMWPAMLECVRQVEPALVFAENVPGLLSASDPDSGEPYFGRILADLAELGYDAEWMVLGADDVGAPHRRKRLWILAFLPDADRRLLRAEQGRGESGRTGEVESGLLGADLADAERERLEGLEQAWPASRTVERGDSVLADSAELQQGQDGKLGARPDAAGLGRAPGSLPWIPWPPGPDDADGWRAYLEAWPGLEPAVCRSAPGVAGGVDLAFRADRLRALGNGWCVPTAVAAFRILYARARIGT